MPCGGIHRPCSCELAIGLFIPFTFYNSIFLLDGTWVVLHGFCAKWHTFMSMFHSCVVSGNAVRWDTSPLLLRISNWPLHTFYLLYFHISSRQYMGRSPWFLHQMAYKFLHSQFAHIHHTIISDCDAKSRSLGPTLPIVR